MAAPERLFLLDGMALAYRAYYSFIGRPLINSKGENTGAIFGFVTMLMKVLNEERPEHIAVVFDTPEPTFRHKRYPEYKATRDKMPEDMAYQLPRLKEVARAFGAPILEVPGYEADDVIGTLARRAEAAGMLTFMVTSDKDFMQLVSDRIKMYRPGKSGTDAEIVDAEGVKAKFGVPPEKVVEVLGLAGDTSDNVPGVPGIGEKTAIPLIQTHGSIGRLYEILEEIPQKGVREKLRANRELAFLSRELVTIKTDTPVDVDIEGLRAVGPDKSALRSMFESLEFRTLLPRLDAMGGGEGQPGGPAVSAAGVASGAAPADAAGLTGGSTDAVQAQPEPIRTLKEIGHTYECVTTTDALARLRTLLEKSSPFAIDTETTSTDPLRARLVGLSFSTEPGKAFYVPVHVEETAEEQAGAIRPDRGEPERSGTPPGELALGQPAVPPHAPAQPAAPVLPAELVLDTLRPVLEDGTVAKVGQNLKYDMLVLSRHGVTVQGAAHDTMVASYVLRADGQHNLDALAMEAFRYRMISYEDLVGTGKAQKRITDIPLEAVSDYAAEDADFTLRIYHRQREELAKLNLLDLCDNIEFPLLPVLVKMEEAGVSIDRGYLSEMSVVLERQLGGLVGEIHEEAGRSFNINSTQQLADVLFRDLGLPPVRKTKTGYSTDVNVLETLAGQHPIIARLLEYRQLAKLKSTYVDALPDLINPETGRLHTSFNQTVASTGRLSSSDPNLQNIPIRTEIGRAIRKAFIPGSADHVLLSADYSQIELRIMAHISGDEGLRAAFLNNEDIHASTAAKVFGVAPGEVTRDMRRKAKEVNFGIMYGIAAFGLANRLEISQAEARGIIARYFERFPKVKQYIQDTIAAAKRDGFVTTLLGRRRFLPDINSRNQNIRGNAERQAINMPIQGTAADMIKLAMIRLDGEITKRALKTRMLLQVHDELVCEVPRTEVDAFKPLVAEVMSNALPLSVPVHVDVGSGANWLEAH
jgi:DNA polymerase I